MEEYVSTASAEQSHTVEAKLAGYKDAKQTVTVEKGGTQRVALALEADSGALGSNSGGGGSGPSVPLIIVGGVAAAIGIGVGIGLRVASSGKADDAAQALESFNNSPRNCQLQPETCESINGSLHSSDQLANGSTVAFVAGGVIGVGTILYAVLAPRRKSPSMQVTPSTGRRGAGLMVGGHF